MSNHEITEHSRDNMLRDFDSGISKLRYELAKNLAETDVLKKEKVENVVSVFNQRLTVFQHDFLQMLAQLRGGAPNRTDEYNLDARSGSHIPTVVGCIAGAVAGSAAAGMAVTTASTGMLWWTSTHAVSLATVLAGAAGVSVDVVSGGLTLGGGIAGAIALNKGVAGIMRKRIRKKIMQDFDNSVVPRLRDWATHLFHE
jgi:hypothetical protein